MPKEPHACSEDKLLPLFFPNKASIHLAHGMLDRLTFLSTSSLVSHPTKPTPYYPPMHADFCQPSCCAYSL
jgi:hypothetical protein